MAKILIAENDLLTADLIEEALTDAGYEVCGIARNVEEGVVLANQHHPDLLLLDLRLDGGLGSEIVPRLTGNKRVGVLYATGNVVELHMTQLNGDAYLQKPYRPIDLLRALKVVEQIVATEKAVLDGPSGFHLLSKARSGQPVAPHSDLEVDRLLRQQAALASFGSFALGEPDLNKVLTEAARICAESFSVPFCKVCRYRVEHNDLLVEAGVGWHPGVVGAVVSRADETSPQGRAFITEQAIICGDLLADSTFVLPSFYAAHGIKSTLDVLIKTKDGQPWGILEIDNPEKCSYKDSDINFLTGFANVLAEAVNTSRRNTAVLVALDHMKDIVADRDRLVRAQSKLLSEKGDLAHELQHRVRNNLQLVYGMLNKEIEAKNESAEAGGISAIARRVMTLAKVYDHLLGSGLARTTDFGGYLTSLCDSFRDLERQDHQDVNLTCESQILMLDLETSTALGLVVAELIANSYLHAFPGNKGTIKISLNRNGSADNAWINFADDGIGFLPEFESKRDGLRLVRRLMQQINGSAVVQSDHGTCWTLKFPLPANVLETPINAIH